MRVGIIGLGGMGQFYARQLAKLEFEVLGSDLPDLNDGLRGKLGEHGIEVAKDGYEVARRSDYTIYCVPVETIDAVVEAYGKSSKKNSVALGASSVKEPEAVAFDRHLPSNVGKVLIHSLHGPNVNPVGQTLVTINHDADNLSYWNVKKDLGELGSNIVELPDYTQHDKITADTQAVTHTGFLSMATAWKNAGHYPWENPSYQSSLDAVKILLSMRILSGKSHLYGGLAILNRYSREQVLQYARSVREFYAAMVGTERQKDELRQRLEEAAEFVFRDGTRKVGLNENIMASFRMNEKSKKIKPNSHLSLLAMVDAWRQTKTNPYDNRICETPPFKLRLGIVENLFMNEKLLAESMITAFRNPHIKQEDLQFVLAVQDWANIVFRQELANYKALFEETSRFFSKKIEALNLRGLSDELVELLG